MHLVFNEVFMDKLQICNHLQGRIHIAGIAQVMKSTCPTNSLDITMLINISARRRRFDFVLGVFSIFLGKNLSRVFV